MSWQFQDNQPPFLLRGLVDSLKCCAYFAPLAKDLLSAWWDDPTPLYNLLDEIRQGQKQLFNTHTAEKFPNYFVKPTDRRFKHASWRKYFFFYWLSQSHVLVSQALTRAILSTQQLRFGSREQLNEILREILLIFSPDHCLFTNPEILQLSFTQNGHNLNQGFKNLLTDLTRWRGYFNVDKSDLAYYKLGDHLANTPGKVVLRNEIMELIHYQPQTESIFRIPLLITPSFINKYYILDLTNQTSFIAWLVSEGFNVYLVSWANATAASAHYGFFQYVHQGVLTALNFIYEYVHSAVHLIGHCVGGIVNSLAGSELQRLEQTHLLKSFSLITSRLDFSLPNKMAQLFWQPEGIDHVEKICDNMNQYGYWDGRKMAAFFNLLNSQEFYWSYFVNRYLRGVDAKPNPLLFWLQDVLHIPARLFNQYLRTARDNAFVNQHPYTLDGIQLNTGLLQWPTFVLGVEKDQLDLWQSVYRTAQLFPQAEFILTQGDHTGGILNPPTRCKYGYWYRKEYVNSEQSAQSWHASAVYQRGSWWPYYATWLKSQCDLEIMAEHSQFAIQPELAQAPGDYVRDKI